MNQLRVDIIDDGYPTTQHSLSIDDINDLTFKEEWGSEIDLKDLNIKLVSNSLSWRKKIDLNAYLHPNFYLNKYSNLNQFSKVSDFIIYDWEYKPESNSDEYLFRILDSTNCPIFIYSAWDKIDDIPNLLMTSRFDKFKKEKRYTILNKSDKESEDIIMSKVMECFNKGKSVKWDSSEIKLIPSKYIIDSEEFWKLRFLLGSVYLSSKLNDIIELSENSINDLFDNSKYKFFIDNQKSILTSSDSELMRTKFGNLTELSMIETLKAVGIDKMIEAKEKGYTEI